LAYQYNTTKGEFFPFQPDVTATDVILNTDTGNPDFITNVCTPTDVKFNRHQLLLTVGYTF
jgi:hypothetical protein